MATTTVGVSVSVTLNDGKKTEKKPDYEDGSNPSD
jgi:hypothetical protein